MISIVSSVFENLILFVFVSNGIRQEKRLKSIIALIVNIVLLSVMNLCNMYTCIKICIFVAATTFIYAKVLNTKNRIVFIKSFIFLLVITLCDVFTLAFFEFISQNDVKTQMEKYVELEWILVGTSKLVCFIILAIFNDRFKFRKEKNYIVTYLPLLTNLLIIFFVGNRILITKETRGSIWGMIITIMIFISSFISIYLIEWYLDVKDIERRNQLLVIQMESQYKFYQAKKEEMQNISSIKHDLKNHLLILETDSTKNQKEYLNNLLARVENYGIKCNTGDEIIDVLLTEKIKIAENMKINISVMVDVKNLNFIDSIEKVTIFGNILDNAIEACQKDKVVERYIYLSGKLIEEFYVLSCKNSYDSTTLKEKEGRLISSKVDRKKHGIGMENVKQAVKKYDGEVIITYDEKEFSVKIIIPISQ